MRENLEKKIYRDVLGKNVFSEEKKFSPEKKKNSPEKKTSHHKIVEKKFCSPKNATFFMFGIDLGQKSAKKTVWE